MPIIYFDNYRGFNSTFIPLRDVNFFVGENSTGKTSILKLIRLLSSRNLWFSNQLNDNETNIGYFTEIISSTSINKGYFEVGILGDSTEEKDFVSAIRIRFIEKNKVPSIKDICFIDNNINVQAIIDGAFIRYRYKIVETKNLTAAQKEEFFRSWIIDNALNDISFIKKEIEYLGIIPTFILINTLIIQDSFIKKKNSDLVAKIKFQIPPFLNNLAWIAPIRTEPRRTYDNFTARFNSEDKHSPYTLKSLLTTGDTANINNVKTMLKKFGQDSGLYDDINIRVLSDKETLQSDKETSPFEILIYLNGRPLLITNVGYGISQILPLIIEVLASQESVWFAIQQPEIHLHPKAQAAFGEFVFKSNDCDGHKFIIETHSDYTIDRFRLRINRAFHENSQSNNTVNSQVVFFSRNEIGNKLAIIEILNDGSYSEDQPKEFREFFIKEELELLTM